ncbi:V-type ATP synthase subunit F [Tetragenococcus halophilus]|uniref:V-type ATP synthase subunit F n=1 Tax=Tetragenococcus halophilus subsp. halophilus TaxID=1513897 RepID=A0A2H6CR72_TETHA|nr:V-type ATP synthase subunit F [Tetragenococcus halophilus]GBD67489.1 hypothetical protein TEHN7118_0295 [Tetragenococcus halophilus subsp. halophilus]GMG62009.1 V-type ATP synthase subunit F [Tetragenococcus halophilus]
MSYKIGVIGDKESVLPFKLFGFTVKSGKNLTEISQTFDEMVENDYGVIYITESYAQQIEKKIEKIKGQLSPAVVLIPDHDGSRGVGLESVEKNMKKAVGQNIL